MTRHAAHRQWSHVSPAHPLRRSRRERSAASSFDILNRKGVSRIGRSSIPKDHVENRINQTRCAKTSVAFRSAKGRSVAKGSDVANHASCFRLEPRGKAGLRVISGSPTFVPRRSAHVSSPSLSRTTLPPFVVIRIPMVLRFVNVITPRRAPARAAPTHRRNTMPSADPARTTRRPGAPPDGNVWSRDGPASCRNSPRGRTSDRDADGPRAIPSSSTLHIPCSGRTGSIPIKCSQTMIGFLERRDSRHVIYLTDQRILYIIYDEAATTQTTIPLRYLRSQIVRLSR